ncbi:hypothetical protein D1007_06018 [Hordeum vulgare]|nr:hypothetical protein D1007_06018 [Hordeum vulgare]
MHGMEGDLEAHKQHELEATTVELTNQEAVAFAKLKTFCTNIVKRLALPLHKEVHASMVEPFTPCRTTQAAMCTSSSAIAKATPAENVLLRAIGINPIDLDPDEVVQK